MTGSLFRCVDDWADCDSCGMSIEGCNHRAPDYCCRDCHHPEIDPVDPFAWDEDE